MSTPDTDKMASPSMDEFTAMLNETLAEDIAYEGNVVRGRIVAIEKDFAVIDVGLKMEGRVPLREFAIDGKPAELKAGDEVEVYLERIENALGEAVLSRDKAKREESWTRLERQFEAGEKVQGVIFNKVKGGFTVDLDGAVAFLPGSQVDIRPVRDIGPLMHQPQPFQILKMDRRRGNIVVSRRSVLEETRAEQRADIVARLEEGQEIDGVVKNITDYGAFIDLGGIDGLLHVTDMAWRRVSHPSEIVNVGDTVKVRIIRINSETQRISLGMKQLQADPWQSIEAKYPVGARFKGTVTNIADYGAFVELEPGVEGLIHVSEMSWTKKNIHPGKIVSTSQPVEVQILEVDPNKRRISLGLKQTQDNPWDSFLDEAPEGHDRRRPDPQHHRVRPVHRSRQRHRRHGPPVGSRLEPRRRRGDQGVQEGRQRQGRSCSTSTAPRSASRSASSSSAAIRSTRWPSTRRATRSPARSSRSQEAGIEAKIAGTDITTFIKRADLSRDRSEQRPERFYGRPKGRRGRDQRRQGGAPACRCRSRRSSSPRRSRPSRSTARPMPAPRSATSSRPPSRSARKATSRAVRRAVSDPAGSERLRHSSASIDGAASKGPRRFSWSMLPIVRAVAKKLAVPLDHSHSPLTTRPLPLTRPPMPLTLEQAQQDRHRRARTTPAPTR